jgi:hypothetical protein
MSKKYALCFPVFSWVKDDDGANNQIKRVTETAFINYMFSLKTDDRVKMMKVTELMISITSEYYKENSFEINNFLEFLGKKIDGFGGKVVSTRRLRGDEMRKDVSHEYCINFNVE